jgi:hypothetical protein
MNDRTPKASPVHLPPPGTDPALSDLVKWVNESADTWDLDEPVSSLCSQSTAPRSEELHPRRRKRAAHRGNDRPRDGRGPDAIEGDERTHALHGYAAHPRGRTGGMDVRAKSRRLRIWVLLTRCDFMAEVPTHNPRWVRISGSPQVGQQPAQD